jgi:hypothetical protein
VEDQPIARRRVGTSDLGRAAHDGFLRHHFDSRTGPRNPALKNRRALDSEAQFLSTRCKGCLGQNVEDVPTLQVRNGWVSLSGGHANGVANLNGR